MLHSSDERTAGGVPVYNDDCGGGGGGDVRLANLMRRERSGFQGQGTPERRCLAAAARAMEDVVSLAANSTNDGELLGGSEVTLVAPKSRKSCRMAASVAWKVGDSIKTSVWS